MTDPAQASSGVEATFDNSEVADYASMTRLDGKVFVVIGGGNGIGRQASHALKSAGATVHVVDMLLARAEQVAGEVGGFAWSADVTDRQQVRELFESIGSSREGLHGVVDVVGMARYKRLLDLTDEDWTWHAGIVFKHAYLVAQFAAPLMHASGGSITYVSSIAGIGSAPGLAAYGACKAALISLVRTAAVELGPLGIRVNSIAPGIVRTPRLEANPAWTDELLDVNIANTPHRRLASTFDVAGALLMLALPLADHITGQSVVVDGGLSTAVGLVKPEPS